MSAVPVGQPTLLVYRECPCGRWCATGEGAVAPKCQACGGYYVPGGGPRDGEPMFGESWVESRNLRCLGFVALLTTEPHAVSLVSQARRLLGLVPDATWNRVRERGRHYLRREVEAVSDWIVEKESEHAPDCDAIDGRENSPACTCGRGWRAEAST